MSFVSFAGRVLFASIFILSAFQEFNEFESDGGPAARLLAKKYEVLGNHFTIHTGLLLPPVPPKDAVLALIAIRGVGGILFILGSSFGAYLLALYQIAFISLMCDFYNHDVNTKEFNQVFLRFSENLAILGAILFFIGMTNSMPRRQMRKKIQKGKPFSKEA